MKTIKTKICALLALLTATCALGACGVVFPNSTDSGFTADSSVSESLNDSSTSESESENNDNASDSNSSDYSAPDDNNSDSGSSDSSSPDEETPDETLALLQAAYALKSGSSLSGTHTLTGVVTNIEKKSGGDICLTFVVGDYTDYSMYCYWLQDADFVKVGYTITVSGKIKNYGGLIEFDHPDLVDYQSNTGNTGGNQGDSGDLGTESDGKLLTNDNKGLPTGTSGVHNVDFTTAKYVKNVADQGSYLDGCPTTCDVKVLVVPVEFSDRTAAARGYTIDKLEKAFNGDMGSTDYRSVGDFYEQSSYGQLNLTFDVLDGWFRPKNNSSYYLQATMEYYGDTVECGDQIIMDEFLRAYDATMDFSKYDSDNNGTIDAIVFINTLSINSDSIMQWAYRYWNIYGDANDEYYEYDGVYANDYMWASYQFLFEDESGDFNDKNALNTYTYIHEFGHVLGADDYYDTSYSDDYSAMGGNDIMDSALGDHNPYSKFNYGWITQSRLIVADSSITLTLDAFSSSGDSIIIANDWDDELGAYQEYFVLMYYTNEGLNANGGGYFSENGVVVYHVNASLYVERIDGTTYYDVYNNNTDPYDPDGYGTENDLIELVKTADGDYVFGQYDPLPANTYVDSGEKIAYTFIVNSLTAEAATLTFRKNS